LAASIQGTATSCRVVFTAGQGVQAAEKNWAAFEHFRFIIVGL
jgi:hypothetical protein